MYRRLDVLPAPLRAMWVLRHVEGEPLHVIAWRTGCSLPAVQRGQRDAEATLEERFVQEYAI